MWNSIVTAVIVKLLKMVIEFLIDQVDSGVKKKETIKEIKNAKDSNDTSVIEHVLNN